MSQRSMMGLTFDVSIFDFLNFQIDLTNLDLECCGAPFRSGDFDTTPDFQFWLFDDAGGLGLGTGTPLDRKMFSPNASAHHVTDFSTFAFGWDASGLSVGIVSLQIDLLTGG